MVEETGKPMTVAQLAARWGVSPNTVRRWLKPFEKEIGPKQGNIYPPRQVAVILSNLGECLFPQQGGRIFSCFCKKIQTP